MVGIHTVVRSRRRPALTVAALGAATALLALTGCSTGGSSANGSYGFPEAKQDTSSTITVWVDADRQAAAKAFEKANPDTKIKVVTYDGSANGSNSFRTKMQLFDRAGSGWPDVVFSSQNNDAAWASQKSNGKQAFAAVLDKGLVPKDTLDNFTEGALNPCTVNGQVYCLRNDLAQAVLWYDKTLMDKFGYAVPTTWEEYQALGEKVAAEHPGYIIGTAGDAWTPEVFMWGSKCQANDITGPKSVTVKTDSTECKRAATLLDTLRENKTVPAVSVFTPEFVKSYAGKVLMMPGPAWYAGAIFNNPQSLNVPAGELGVAAPLPWKGEDKAVTGNVGGGTWFISSHSKNLKAAEKFAQFVTTSDDYQVDVAPGYPAYAPAAKKWIEKQEASKYYATSLEPVATAASQVWDGWGYGVFSQEAVWAKTMTPAITGGKSIESLLPTWQEAIANQAKVDGYKVN
ncbi:carbohydrate ABC transporter substrate-binding protein, CUT1 family [Leifsonia sp. 98AMF]|jgi:multiple sugar transport system substrate-binding protein|uniref:ABC transporter substrate-binding protein n=1 Tax=Microbacteriaceae TaxID=85023 RepID=UPI00037C4F3D|nr:MULTISPECIES: extracellular solute-binding protein [Microbacteriaceae]TDQ02128.1 carbohydrate ABC transporter substrate-binding protein (CUT1 family) [Leifsonia sp. 115AMFTsu3.1]SDH04234.1 carbohydrate ABC transporter substrate-binding protein, CUT1 family [Leifsonia sp. 197AMF]SDJ36737.1 carbohydrate ABC transporter substrate-binding protein, CUT1 family [Leifsonia sp. 466MF]SDK42680.1 carbohydrate ABC transporter substrate-binding protein, CUT1 family [Leifsonia sp. 157MF]SDN57034.1 carbo